MYSKVNWWKIARIDLKPIKRAAWVNWVAHNKIHSRRWLIYNCGYVQRNKLEFGIFIPSYRVSIPVTLLHRLCHNVYTSQCIRLTFYCVPLHMHWCVAAVVHTSTMLFRLHSIRCGSVFYDVMVMIVILLFIVYPFASFSQSDFAKFYYVFISLEEKASQQNKPSPLATTLFAHFVDHCWNCLCSWKVIRKRNVFD